MGSSCKVAPVGAAIHFANFAMLIIPVHPSGVGRVINQSANFRLVIWSSIPFSFLLNHSGSSSDVPPKYSSNSRRLKIDALLGRVRQNQCANYPLICLERVKLAGLCRGVPLYTKNACTTKLLVLQLLYQLEEGSSWQRQLVTSG